MKAAVKHYKEQRQVNERNLPRIRTDSDRKKTFWQYFFTNAYYQIIVGFVLVVIIFFAWVNFQSRPVSETNNGDIYIEIISGMSSGKLSQVLDKNKLIRSKIVFLAKAKLFSPGVLQAGNYKLNQTMSIDDMLKKFHSGDIDAFKITIPEGYRVLQIAKEIQQKAEIDSNLLIESAIGTEGTLFPDTYVFAHGLPLAKIIGEMKEDFQEKTSKLDLSHEDLIIASIVEREAITNEERPKIATVYKNRLRENMRLEADPTVRYAMDTQIYLKNKNVDFTFWQPVTRSDINSTISPFNTYKNKGLPPAPICNPGLKSIEATINYDKGFSDYYYFFHDAEQKIHFEKTLSEHTKDIAEYGLPNSR